MITPHFYYQPDGAKGRPQYMDITGKNIAVIYKKLGTDTTDRCPFCNKKHGHWSAPGTRSPHCHGREKETITATDGTQLHHKDGYVIVYYFDGYDLGQFIKFHFRKAQGINTLSRNSESMAAVISERIGRNVTNAELKEAMQAQGYKFQLSEGNAEVGHFNIAAGDGM